MADFFGDLDRLRLSPTVAAVPTQVQVGVNPARGRRVRGEFVKGPLPLLWLTVASKLPGKAPLAVGLAAWFESGRRRSMTVTLTTAILARFGVRDRKAKYRGLCALERAGLVAVIRVPRRNPTVTILDAQELQQHPEREGS